MTLILQLLLAHMLGDFLLQPKAWVEKKMRYQLRAPELYIHSVIHGLLAWLFTGILQFWGMAVVIALSHGCIDACKLLLQKPETQRKWFFIDQLLHLAVIVVVWYLWQDPVVAIPVFSTNVWLYLSAIAGLTLPTSIVIRTIFSKWHTFTDPKGKRSLRNAGEYIGILERLMTFTFVVTNHWEAVGFLIAAKSIFRFGDLNNPGDRERTEYILIGTLLSFGIAIATGMGVQFLIRE